MAHVCELQVRTYECDAYGHVNNAVYLNYLEYARLELLKADGIDYFGLIRRGWGVTIGEISIRYLRSAFADDVLRIETACVEQGAAFGVVDQNIFRAEELIAAARVKWICVDAKGRPVRVPEELKKSRIYIDT